MNKKAKKNKNVKPPEDEIKSIEPDIISEGDTKIILQTTFPIVGIGASAGGLAAIEAFFSGMPADKDTGMAFILVQHLAPDHKSILSELIRRYTRMQVFEVTDGLEVLPNCAYIIPPNHDMAFMNGKLHLFEPNTPRGQRLPINFFFRSLAFDLRERSICIILSGTGSDGTAGARLIKGEGGIVMAQNPESTEYDGMPRSVINAGIVDYILPPAEMPAQLISYVEFTFRKISQPLSRAIPRSDDLLKKVLILLRNKTGNDFSLYKQNTIIRRIERRMAVHQIEQIDQYVRFIQQNTDELDSLFKDLLIGVTNFFRDTEAFVRLRKMVIPQIFAGKSPDEDIRIWVPGCSTGEEAYSIAILLQEYMDEAKRNYKIHLFATDIDSRAIEQARSGIYPASINTDISEERLTRFFNREQDSTDYRIKKNIRDMIVFSEQNVIKDPPFSKLNFISCRNLLIYMSSELQKKIIPLFHYALKPGCFLFLGSSETLGEYSDIFTTIDSKSKLFKSKENLPGMHQVFKGKLFPSSSEGIILKSFGQAHREIKPHFNELITQTLINHYSPVGILVNELGDILHIHGRTGKYLEPAPGEANMNILKMAREGLKKELITTLHKSILSKKPENLFQLRVKTNGDFTTINLTVQPAIPVKELTGRRDLYLVIIEEEKSIDKILTVNDSEIPADESINVDARIKELELELLSKEEFLQSTNEELETSNEELKSSNEEMQSINEELQSTNEELETSKEELQSVNEELITVNAELQSKVTILSRVNNDMNNLLAGTGIGTIFVDHSQSIRRFTPAVTNAINLITSDIGRPLRHIASNLLDYNELIEDVQGVLDTLVSKEIEVQTKTGAWLLLQIRPYRTLENVIEGAVISFVDITKMKHTQKALDEASALRRLAIVVRDSFDAITVQDLSGRILAWNPIAEKMYGWSETEALDKNIRDLVPETERDEALSIVKRLCGAEVLEPYRMKRLTKDGRVVNVRLVATALMSEDGNIYAIATTERELKSEK